MNQSKMTYSKDVYIFNVMLKNFINMMPNSERKVTIITERCAISEARRLLNRAVLQHVYGIKLEEDEDDSNLEPIVSNYLPELGDIRIVDCEQVEESDVIISFVPGRQYMQTQFTHTLL